MAIAPGAPKKPIPTWYYAAGAVGLAVVYFLWKKQGAASAAAAAAQSAAQSTATQSTGAAQVYPSGSYGNANDLSALLPYLQNLNGQASTPTASSSSGVSYSPPSGETLAGSGYGTPTGSNSVTGTNGHIYAPVANWPQAQTLIGQGQSLFYQPLPGVFLAHDPTKGEPGPTPLFLQVA
jgi:hypothetical protein